MHLTVFARWKINFLALQIYNYFFFFFFLNQQSPPGVLWGAIKLSVSLTGRWGGLSGAAERSTDGGKLLQ